MSIPSHNRLGIIPPFTGTDLPSAMRMSPYEATFVEIVSRFATSSARVQMLYGLLDYRAALRSFGVASGFQWIDGSFVEMVVDREPGDIDVVTFGKRPDAYDPAGRWLFDPLETKKRFFCDAYFVNLGKKDRIGLIERVTYYYGVFSHRKPSLVWKGMVQVDLGSEEADGEARALLGRLRVSVGKGAR